METRLAWLALDPDVRRVVVSHESAADLFRLAVVEAESVAISTDDETVPVQPEIALHICDIPTEDLTIVEGIMVTSPRRLVQDLSLAQMEAAHLGAVVADVLARNFSDEPSLAEALDPAADLYGTESGVDLLDALLRAHGAAFR